MAETNHICLHCSGAIVPRTCKTGKESIVARLYCSPRCKDRAKANRRGPRLAFRKVTCGWCGHTVVKPRCGGRQVYCSRLCGARAASRVRVEIAALSRIAKAWRQPAPYSLWVKLEVRKLYRIGRYRETITYRPCRDCGASTRGTLNRTRLCATCGAAARLETRRKVRKSPLGRARKQIERATRRARQYVAIQQIDPIAVFEREGWVCYMCGILTPKHLRGTMDPCAPELEHEVPLAAGGTHTWGNVRCACRACNGSKGARVAA